MRKKLMKACLEYSRGEKNKKSHRPFAMNAYHVLLLYSDTRKGVLASIKNLIKS